MPKAFGRVAFSNVWGEPWCTPWHFEAARTLRFHALMPRLWGRLSTVMFTQQQQHEVEVAYDHHDPRPYLRQFHET